MQRQANVRLKIALLESGQHQYEIAEACGLTELKLSKIVTGRSQVSEVEKTKIARKLKRPVGDLFEA